MARERVVRDPADHVEHGRDLDGVTNVRLELIVSDGEVCPVCLRDQPEARLQLDRAALVRDEGTIVDDDVSRTTIVSDPEREAVVQLKGGLRHLWTNKGNK